MKSRTRRSELRTLNVQRTDPDLLAHPRPAGPHRRGCWGVHLVVEKE
jgi:hypothetical protein